MGQNQPSVDAAQSSTQNYTPPTQRVFTQDEVNYLVTKVKSDTYEQSRREMSQVQQQQAPAQPAISIEDVVKQAKDELRAELKTSQDDAYVRQLMHTHNLNLESGRKKYGKDFDESVGSINFGALPQLVPLLNSLPNADDVMHELGKDENESRFDTITNHLAKGQFVKAERAMKRFSDSLSGNKDAAEKAQAMPSVPEPLGNIKPSTASAGTGKAPQTYAEISAHIDKMMSRRR